jgi:hypothetical protein
MTEYSYATINPISYPQQAARPGNHPEVTSRFARSTGNGFPVAIYHTNAISDIATREMMVAPWLSLEGTYSSVYVERAYASLLLAPPPMLNALDLLEQWYATASHQPEGYWDELQDGIAANRFTLQKNGG